MRRHRIIVIVRLACHFVYSGNHEIVLLMLVTMVCISYGVVLLVKIAASRYARFAESVKRNSMGMC